MFMVLVGQTLMFSKYPDTHTAEECKLWQIITDINYMAKVYMVSLNDVKYRTTYHLTTKPWIMTKVSILAIHDFQQWTNLTCRI